MAQLTFTDGSVLTASQINTYLMGEGGAWSTWTPTVTQSGSVTVTNTRSVYARYGRTIHFTLRVSVTGSGTGSNAVVVSLPVTAASASEVVGYGQLSDSSAVLNYQCIAFTSSTTAMQLLYTGSSTSGVLGAAHFTAGLASGDTIAISGTYEAAS